MKFPFPVHFVRKVPVADLQLRPTAERVADPKAPWFFALAEDVEKNGLANPLLVINQVGEFKCKAMDMRVKTGQNRLRVLRRLGWKHAPCIVVGPLPDGLEGVPLYTLPECQALLSDGLIGREAETSLRINSAMLPEQGKFPKAEVRYFDVD